MLRRLGLLFSALLTLNLSAAEIMRVCASQSEHQQQAPMPAEHHQHHAPTPVPSGEDCDKPAQKKCCAAVSSCGPTLAIDGAVADSIVVPDRKVSITGTAGAPTALERSPEPPPPKR